MKMKRIIPFKIVRIDSLGQGVSKNIEKVAFIPKTTLGDVGEAEVMSEKKGVLFGRVKSFQSISQDRIKPQCEHFQNCPSCHFLHVSYSHELIFKKESFENLFRKIPLPEVEVVGAPERFFYRNRIQLHYSLKSKLLGMKDPQTFQITPIPKCLIGLPEVLNEIKKLYDNNSWLNLAPPSPQEGHVEIYYKNNQIGISWNRPYAEGGFTQVHEKMNSELKKILMDQFSATTIDGMLDLFGGNGNLSKDLSYQKRLCVDIYSGNLLESESFMNQNLYDEKALERLQKHLLKRKDFNLTHLLLDPPRSGLKDLSKWLEVFKPKFVAYISCDPHTMVRDLTGLTNYQFSRAILLDFFPSTFHFESMIFLERKE
jgi:23S rRNA (uracil1939-C5)-methyltransferase